MADVAETAAADVFRDRTVVFLGRLGGVPQRAARREVERRGGRIRRAIDRRTDLVVVGHLACRQLDGGRLQRQLERAAAAGARRLSENRFLALAGLRPAGPVREPTLSLATLAAQSGLDATSVELLALFDVIEATEEGCGFRDVVAARAAAGLLAQGASLAEIVAGSLALHDNRDPLPRSLAEARLVRAAPHGLAVALGDGLAELDGQMRLALAEDGNPTREELLDAAERAEDAGRLERAERCYRRCVAIDGSDPVALFNLANVVRERGRGREARLHLERALGLDPGYGEAWYNLADLAEAEGDRARARSCLGEALAIDPDFADALFNLARLHYRDGAFAEAVPLFERYLELDAASEWSRAARDHLAVCRRALGRVRRRPA